MPKEHDVVKVIKLTIADREYDGTAGISQSPSIGDVGAVVHKYDPKDANSPLIIEMTDGKGNTIWLADFDADEEELVESV